MRVGWRSERTHAVASPLLIHPTLTTKFYDILLADDNRADVQLMQLALLEAGFDHNLHVVEDGDKALAFLRREEPYADAARPDLVLLDMNMPRMSGHDVLDQVRTDDGLKAIPVVILTTSADPTHVLTSYSKFANSHITKPMDFDDLIKKVVQGINGYWFNLVELPSR
jgi:CheY-like chemotaxis protein